MIRLPSTRTFALLALAGFLVFPVGSIAFGDRTVDDLPHGLRIPAFAFAGLAFLVMAYSLGALMVRLYFRAVGQRAGAKYARAPAWIGDPRLPDRMILALWSVWTAGLLVVGAAAAFGLIPL